MDRRSETVRDSGYPPNIAEVAPFQVVDSNSCGPRPVAAGMVGLKSAVIAEHGTGWA
jgi:hypothetical protein